MRKYLSLIWVVAAFLMLGTTATAQTCPSVGPNVDIRFNNVRVDCTNDSLFVDIELSNPTGTAYSVSSMSLRFTYNTAMLGNPRISQQVMAGSASIAQQNGVWSYGLVEFSPANSIPASGAWTKVTRLGFPVLNFDALGNSNCINLRWNTTVPAITTIQQWISFSCQPNMVFTSYGNNSTCIVDSCNSTSGALNLTALPTNVTCTGSNDGTVDLTVTGGTAPYSYLWSNGAITQDISGLAPGTYSVTVTDATSQTATLGSLVVGSNGLTVQYTVTDASCNQTDDGAITINNVLGGTGPYSYSWSTGATTQNLNLLIAGTYGVTVTDVNGCQAILRNIVVNEPAEFQYNVFINNISCAGGSDGALDFTLTGGTPPYTYLWVRYDLNTYLPLDTLGTTEDLAGLVSGLYGVEVEDANGCTGAVFFLLVEPNPIEVIGLPSDIRPVSCAGQCDGGINISANGGTGVISFLWSNGAQTEDLENVCAGTYTVTATDLSGCTATKSFVITQPDTIKIVIDPILTTNVSCYGGNDGAIGITVTGGNGSLTFNWSNGATTKDISGLTAGTYSVTVSDLLGCQGALANIVVTQPDSLTLTATPSSVSCNATNDGTITLAVTGGTSPYTFNWGGGVTTQNRTGLVAGNYTVTVTDAKGCVKTTSITVGVANCPPIARNDINNTFKNVPVSGDISTNDYDPDGDDLSFTVISGPSNGTLTAFDPATGTYTYTPNNNFVGEDSYTYFTCDNGVPSLCDTATVYIEVLDDPKDPFNNPPVANADHYITYVNTTVNSTVINNDYDPDTADIISVTTSLIQNPSNGTFVVSPNGGFTYIPNNGFVGNDTVQYQLCDNGTPGPKCDTTIVVISVLPIPGNPTNLPPVAVDDAFYTEVNNPVNGNVIPNDYDTDGNQIAVTVPQFSGPSNGTVTINPNGTFTYTPNNNYVGPDQFVYILCDNGNPSLCDTATVYILIQNPANRPPIARNDINNTLVNVPVDGDISTNDYDPDGDDLTFTVLTGPSNGTLTAFDPATGTYTYTPGNNFVGHDTYTYQVCDNGIPSLCDTATVYIEVLDDPKDPFNNPPVANADHFITYINTPFGSTVINNDYDPDTADLITVNTSLVQDPSNGTIAISPNGDFTYTPNTGFIGNDTLRYQLCDNGNPGPKCDTAIVVITVLFNPMVGNLPPVAVDDAFYTEINTPVNNTVIPNDYDTDGNQITVNVPQQSGPAHGTVTISANGDFIYTPNAGYTGPDQFTYVLCDNGVPSLCDTATVYIIIQNPANQPPLARNDINNTLFNTPVSGSVATNDEEPDGDAVTFTQLTNTTNGTITGFDPATGTYTYTPNAGFIGTDYFTYSICDNGIPSLCDSALVTIHVLPPFNFVNNPPVANPDDYVTYANLSVNGTVIPNDFDPDNGDVITVGIVLVSNPTNGTVTSINPNGTFTYVPNPGFTGEDSFVYILCDNGTPSLCDTALVTIHVLPTTFGTNLPPVAVDDAYITEQGVPVVNTVIPNDYDQDGNQIAVTVPQLSGPANGTLTISPNGDFVYTPNAGYTGPDQFTYILCDNGNPSLCDTATAYITIYSVMSIALDDDSVDCFGASTGSITVTITNGNAPFTFLWSNGATTQNLTGVPAGIYSVTVTDAFGVTVAGTDTIGQPAAAIAVTETIVTPTCNGLSDASISIAVSGGTPAYTYSWTGPNGFVAATQNISGLVSGTYNLTVTDANGCIYTNSYVVTQPNVLVATVDGSIHIACNGASTGSIDISVAGGTPNFTFSWSGPNGFTASTEDITGLAVGTYTVTVTDANGCTATVSETLTQNPVLVVSANLVTNVTCDGLSNGAIDINVNGGVAPYTYVWSNPAASNTQDITGLPAGTYTVTVTDNAGCTATGTFTVTQPQVLTASATVDQNVTCFGGNNGSINLTVNGGTAAFTYSWSGPNGFTASTEDLNGVVAGTYNVTVTDANGCSATASATITENPQLVVSLNSSDDVSCFGGNDGEIDITATGGVGPYTYAWSNGATTEDLSGLVAGTYGVTVTDAVGCTATGSFTIGQPTLLVATIDNQTNVACNGASTGAIDLGVTGGTAPYTYAWSSGQITQDLTGLAAGTYTVTVTDAQGCTATASATITESPALVVALDEVLDAACNGTPTGSIFLVVTGGVGPYDFAWSGPNGYVATTQNISGLLAGTYTITVTDANNCTATGSFTVNEPATLVASATADNVVTCFGGNDGSISTTVTGGTAPYTYAWSNTAITQNINGLTAGTYTVTVTDANGCTAVASATVTENPQLVVSLNGSEDVSCFGGNDGEIDITVTGGVGPYTYAWSNGATTEDLSGLVAGTYGVTVTDAVGCTATGSFTIGQPTLLVATIDNQTDVACSGASTGAIDLGVTGGTASYTYAWSNGQITQDLTGLAAGTYTVTVTDANGCTATASATITENNPLVITATATDNVSCFGQADGALDITVTGGVGPYTFSWSNGATTEDISGLTAGTYDVTVTDAVGCTASASFTITQPTELTFEPTVTNVTCGGGANGTAGTLVGGGTTPYTYAWSNGATTSSLSGLTAGVYTVTVTDANGCTIGGTVSIIEENVLVVNTAVTNATCGQSNGVAGVSVSGGSGNFTYAWSVAGNTASISGLAAGTYTVTVTDATNGCTATRTVAVSATSDLAVTPTVTNASCGASNGSVTLAVTGGTAPYTYAWSNGGNTNTATGLAAGTYSVTVNSTDNCPQVLVVEIENDQNSLGLIPSVNNAACGQANGSATVSPIAGTAPYTFAWSNGANTATANNLAAGTYFVTVTDAGGCSEVATINVGNLNGPAVSIDNIVDVTCANGSTGSVSVVVSGGVGPYTYMWSTGDVGRTISSVAAGTYTVTVTDANGCQSSLAATVGTPDAIDVIVDATQVSCNNANNGAVTVRVSGGLAPYSFAWSTGANSQNLVSLAPGTYTVTVTDANGCNVSTPAVITQPDVLAITNTTTDVSCTGGTNGAIDITVTGGTAPYTYAWSNGAATADLVSLQAGVYTVTVTDANGCTASSTISVNTLNTLVLNMAATNATCGQSNGVATVSVSGGSGSFTYNWGTGNTASINNLAPGVYTVTVTDAVNGCTAVSSVPVSGSSDIDVTYAISDVTCGTGATGAISLGVTGGVAPYTYAWSTPLGNGANASGLTAGTYYATVTDAGGCQEVLILNVVEISILRVISNVTAATCGQANGAIDLVVTGGSAPYTYAWSNGANTSNITGLAAGIYFVTVTDVNGCAQPTTITVGNVSGPAITVDNVVNPTCANGSTGEVSISVTGGAGPYTYSWSNGATTEDLTGLATGAYILTVTDANGCQASVLVAVVSPDAIEVIAEGFDVSCNGANDGSINTRVRGGIAPYTYAWSNGANTPILSGLAAGTYTVTVTDANGCTVATPVVITQPDVLVASATATGVQCNGGADGTITTTVTGGTTPYTYLWNNGANTANLTGLAAGLYTATITDANGCTATVSATVDVVSSLVINLGITNATCGDSNGEVAASVAGGVAPYTYQWSVAGAGNTQTGLAAGTYGLTVTDANGCSATTVAAVSSTSDIVVVPTVTPVVCGGGNTGAISLAVTGGSGTYTYTWSIAGSGASINSLAAGTYTVTVTDGDCQTVVSIAVGETSPLVVASTVDAANCGRANGEATVTVTGGVAPYTYAWSNGAAAATASNLSAGLYEVTITDANGCSATEYVVVPTIAGVEVTLASSNGVSCGQANGAISINVTGGAAPYNYLWSNGATTANLSGLNAGTYAVTVTDANGCIGVLVATVDAAEAVVFVADRTDITCFNAQDGSIGVSIVSGAGPFTYQWSPAGSGSSINNVGAGNYAVTVTAANGCSATANITLSQPNALVATLDSATNVRCNGLQDGAIDVTVTGGTQPYTYAWTPNGANTEDLSGLGAGTYTLVVTDANGCSSQPLAVTITEPAALTLTLASADTVSCNGGADATATVTATGGTAPYTYVWSNGDSTATADSLSVGTYTVSVVDANGCTSNTITVEITQPAPIEILAGGSNLVCYGDSSGQVRIKSVTGGVAPYTYNWSNGAGNVTTISNLPAGSYTVTVTDANGCTATSTTVLTDPAQLVVVADVVGETCADSSNGSIQLTISGGTGAVTVLWSNNAQTDFIDNLADGDYSVTVTDANGCNFTATYTVAQGNCNHPPIADNDTVTTTSGNPITIPVLDNDSDPDGDDITVTGVPTTPPVHGTTTINSDGTITYTPDGGFVGIDSFMYTICDDGIPSLCDSAWVIISVLPERPNVSIPNGFSPDGDGINDNFEIVDISQFPNNKLMIFNRWGNTVFEAQPYNNDWNGGNMDGEPLPDGTYFYVLEINDGTTPPYTGFVVIHRGSNK